MLLKLGAVQMLDGVVEAVEGNSRLLHNQTRNLFSLPVCRTRQRPFSRFEQQIHLYYTNRGENVTLLLEVLSL